MPIAAALPALGSIASVAAPIVGGVMASNAAGKAAKTQAAAANKATDLQREQWLKTLELNKPFYDAGVTGQNALLQYLGLGGDPNAANYGAGMKPFTGADLATEPGYAFRLSEGVNALNKQAAAKGGLISGAALKEAQRYGQDYASNEYQNAYNRYWNQRNQLLNPLEALRGQAQTAAGTIGTAGQNYATQVGQNMMGAANARASGYVGGANALNQALGAAYKNYQALPSSDVSPYTYGAGGYYGAGPFMPGGQ